MRFKALAFDLDGTLLDGNERVSERNLEALEKARAAGLTLIVASARWRQIAQQVAKEIETAAPLVACSGAQVWRQSDERDLLDIRLPEPFAIALYAICDANRCVATIGVDDEVVLKLDGEPDASQLPSGMRWVRSLSTGVTPRPRICLIQGTETNALIRAELEGDWGSAVRFVESISPRGKSILTMTATGADKGRALQVVCTDLGISPHEVVAFGDAENDIDMFRVAGASVAMGQAAEHVKAAATFVSARYDEGGVAVGIERLLRTGEV